MVLRLCAVTYFCDFTRSLISFGRNLRLSSQAMTTPAKKLGTALILPGAVAKGAYEAGVISILTERNVKIHRIVATSSGALNAVAYAAAIRAGTEKDLGKRLRNAWLKYGSWNKSFSFNPFLWLSGRGLSDPDGLMTMLKELVVPSPAGAKGKIELRIIVASMEGIRGLIGKNPATTYEKVLSFCGKDFDTQEGLDRIFKATVAACAFPGLFAPVRLPGIGYCVDGGAVNNAPVEYALDDGDIGQIIVAVPFPRLLPKPKPLHGLGLINHMAEILINERLYRDLKNAHNLNLHLADLDELVKKKKLHPQHLEAVKSVLPFRKVQIIEVRPPRALGGTVFTGFTQPDLRKKFIAEGRKAALKNLKHI